ncbi:MAG: SIMPL domain-containing protein [Actinomycetota bacterium]
MNKNLIKRITVLAIALSLVGGVALAPASMAATPKRYMTISADGTVKVIPDAVRLNATVSVVASTSKEALAQASVSAAAVRAALIANEVSTKDIATQSVTVYPEYLYTQDKGSVLVGYRANQSFNVVIRNAANAGAIVDAVVGAGGDNLQLNGVTPFVLDSTKATASARSRAVKNAKAKAYAYASLLKIKLGKVNYLVENSSPVSYPPIMSVTKGSAASTQIDLGQQDVTVSITIQWALR